MTKQLHSHIVYTFHPDPSNTIDAHIHNVYISYHVLFWANVTNRRVVPVDLPEAESGTGSQIIDECKTLFTCLEDGVKLQASDEMYEKQKMYDKGHLLPVGIYSFDKNYAQSTFTYTNAVPQIRLFNRGAWKKYEGEIREFAETCGRRGGNLYAITGAAQLAQYNGAVMPLKQLKSKICVPQAMWTASCCVTSSGVENYAVVGNNRGSASDITMTEVTVEKLQEFIHKDIKAHGDNPATSVRLFPGKPECENRKNSKRKAEPDDAEPSSPKKVKTKKPQSQNTIY